jgi:hypothetical protein
LIRGSRQPPYAIVGKFAPPVQSSTAAQRHHLPMTQMVAQFQMRRDQDKTKAEPNRRREMRNTLRFLSPMGAANNAGEDRVKLRMGSGATGTGG